MSNDCFRFGASGVPCCFSGCEFFSDTFSTGSGSPPGTVLNSNWEERVGDWQYTGTRLIAQDTPNAIVISNIPATGNIGNIFVCSHIEPSFVDNTSDNNNCARHIVNYIDDNNYYYGELRQGRTPMLSNVSVGKVVGGVNTVLNSRVAAVSPGYYFLTCLTELGQLRAGVTSDATANPPLNCNVPVSNNNPASFYVGKAGLVSNVWGLGTGAMPIVGGLPGQIRFDEVLCSLNDLEDTTCPICFGHCRGCIDRHPPARLQVQITGLVNELCTRCDRKDGTFILIPEVNIPNFYCTYRFTGPPLTPPAGTGCSLTGNIVQARVGASTVPNAYEIFVNVNASGTSGNHTIQFKKTFTQPIDCLNLNNELIPWDFDGTLPSGDKVCTGATATCLVTSLDP